MNALCGVDTVLGMWVSACSRLSGMPAHAVEPDRSKVCTGYFSGLLPVAGASITEAQAYEF
jgi:hypothetical protein